MNEVTENLTHWQKINLLIAKIAEAGMRIEVLEQMKDEAPAVCQKLGMSIAGIGDYLATVKQNIAFEYAAYKALCKERTLEERAWEIKDLPARKPLTKEQQEASNLGIGAQGFTLTGDNEVVKNQAA